MIARMLGLFRKTRHCTAQTLLVLFASAWLVASAAPCVMAAPHCNMADMSGVDCPDHTDSGALTSSGCGVAMHDCRLPDSQLPNLDSTFRLTPPLALLASPPLPPLTVQTFLPPRWRELGTILQSSTPLYLRKTVLLI